MVMCPQQVPELSFTLTSVSITYCRGAVESADGRGRIAANDMFVVAVVLGKGFLEDRTKEGTVFSNLGIQCTPAVAPWPKWEPVVDNDCVGDAEGV